MTRRAREPLETPPRGDGDVPVIAFLDQPGKQWTDSGESHDDRGLKDRPTEDVRRAPVPPQLVRVFREHIDTFGTAGDGRLFSGENGGVVSSTCYRAWQEAREPTLPPAVRKWRIGGSKAYCGSTGDQAGRLSGRLEFPDRAQGNCTVLYRDGRPDLIGYWGVTAD
ncbi:hypothetical protein [Streptomyces sp. PanSC19]|uniref:hypothetical protein n=1 Tax=Streptomyces sp. PanSC19 TaxID=1520455 RepID=UPI0026BF35C2